jgi:monofunctional biosynthetic peptidoglycan transglycosylase
MEPDDPQPEPRDELAPGAVSPDELPGAAEVVPGAGETESSRAPEPTAEEPAAAPSRRRGCLRVVLVLFAVGVVWLGWEAATWPKVAVLARERPGKTAFMWRWVRRTGKSIDWRWVPYSRISPNLKRAVLVGEDINFFSHDGFDTAEQRQALAEAWKEKRLPRGASTISQQVAKNLWLDPSYSPLRKAKEALLTVQLEHDLSKRRILEIYLNVAELGPGIFGAEAAARHYFGIPAAELSESQAAALAAGLPSPEDWHPGSTRRAYTYRVRLILRRMAKAHFLWKLI